MTVWVVPSLQSQVIFYPRLQVNFFLGVKADFTLNVVIDNHPVSFFVHKRPHVDYFLETVSKWFDLVVFTASMEVYGKGNLCTVMARLLPIFHYKNFLIWKRLYITLQLWDSFSAVCDKLEENKPIFKKRLYRQDCRQEYNSYTKVIKILKKYLL